MFISNKTHNDLLWRKNVEIRFLKQKVEDLQSKVKISQILEKLVGDKADYVKALDTLNEMMGVAGGGIGSLEEFAVNDIDITPVKDDITGEVIMRRDAVKLVTIKPEGDIETGYTAKPDKGYKYKLNRL